MHFSKQLLSSHVVGSVIVATHEDRMEKKTLADWGARVGARWARVGASILIGETCICGKQDNHQTPNNPDKQNHFCIESRQLL